MVSKADLRRRIRGELAARSPAELAAASEKIRAAITELAAWKDARSVGLFAPLAGEPGIDPLFATAQAAGKRVYYPQVTPEGLVFAEVRDLTELVTGRWQLREPANGESPAALDLVLVPGMAFTAGGGRLGRGGGYYDRLLESLPETATVGVCFSCQLVESIPVEAHDRTVKAVVTEDGPAI